MTEVGAIDVKTYIKVVCDEMGDFLVGKNEAYGNSAIDPRRIFAKSDTREQLYVRIDDKLNRIMGGHDYPGDDTVTDLLGYLILLKVHERIESDRQGYEDYAEASQEDGQKECQKDCSCEKVSEEGGQGLVTNVVNVTGPQVAAAVKRFFARGGPEETWEGEGGSVQEDDEENRAENVAAEVFKEYYASPDDFGSYYDPKHARPDEA